MRAVRSRKTFWALRVGDGDDYLRCGVAKSSQNFDDCHYNYISCTYFYFLFFPTLRI